VIAGAAHGIDQHDVDALQDIASAAMVGFDAPNSSATPAKLCRKL
jgi:hypothetical protein